MAKKKKKKTKNKVVKKGKTRKKKKAGRGKKKKGVNIAYLGLGSNVGDREEYLEQAIFLLEKNPKVDVLKRSSSLETEAEGGKGDQQMFVNGALEIKTKLSPQELLDLTQEIEAALGREREIEWGPRTIDIDILLYNDEILSDDKLQIPHPLMHERLFVLKPLAEISPSLKHPVLEKTIGSLYEEKKAELGGRYDDELPGFKEIKGGSGDDYERW
ncbi:MAG: 2-amino-4-hydroxy-6-hydroxymethyldihydropteridine diphosphokinase [Candidatus Margulisiibacteriota bacterium]|nr:2-amino-4-hydroxy-6-hydroxymethyldihydropteridine diphosphokinase [Candidatus Margulisiibacteriota bacterium]